MNERLLNDFWEWLGCTKEEYAASSIEREEFMYPNWDMLINSAIEMIRHESNESEDLDYLLTVMALDNEEENILDYLADNASESYLIALIELGINHPLRDARWQTAELIRRARPQKWETYLSTLENDTDKYVLQRTENAAEFLKHFRN